MDIKWLEDNFFDIAFFVVVVIILFWSMITNDASIVDKILLVALGMFKGVSVIKKE